MKQIGIYKITSPSGKIYVGQTINIEKRWSEYKLSYSNLYKQPKIFRSFEKYGVEAHQFEIIEECEREQLNEREIYWGEYYNTLGPNGLNLKLGNAKGKMSEETKKQISTSLMGKPKNSSKKGEEHKHFGKSKSDEHKQNIKLGKQNISDETKQKMSENMTGKKLGKSSVGSGRKKGFKYSDETKEKMRQIKLGKTSNHKGFKDSDETKNKKRLSMLGKVSKRKGKKYGKLKNPPNRQHIQGSGRNKEVIVINLLTNEVNIYKSASLLKDIFNISGCRVYYAIRNNKTINNLKFKFNVKHKQS